MLVCHCEGVHERAVRDAIASGARDVLDVARACGAGSGCGGCVTVVQELLGQCSGCPLVLPASALAAQPV